MRQAYLLGLAELDRETEAMCTVAGGYLRDATQALLTADLALAEQVIGSQSRLMQLRETAETRAVQLLTLQAPVAADLRKVVTALWNVGDLSRMGVLAGHIAKTARRRHPTAVVPQTVRPIIERMGRFAAHVADQTSVVLSERDIHLARRLEAQDAQMDDEERAIFAAVLAPTWSHGVEAAIDVSLLARFYERFADHAVFVTRRVSFLVTGNRPAALPARVGTWISPITHV